MPQMAWRTFGQAFVSLLVILDPLVNIPLFLALTHEDEPRARKLAAYGSVLVAGSVVALLMVLASLRFASELARLLRPNAIHFLTRIMGLLLTRHRGAARRRRRSAVGPIGSGLSAIGAFDAPTRKCMNAADRDRKSTRLNSS